MKPVTILVWLLIVTFSGEPAVETRGASAADTIRSLEPAPPADRSAGDHARPGPALALEGEGLRLVDPATGSTRPLPFGTARSQLLAALAFRRPHHRDLDAHVAQSGDAARPIPFDRGSPFELETKLGEELDRGIEILHHDPDVVHPSDCH